MGRLRGFFAFLICATFLLAILPSSLALYSSRAYSIAAPGPEIYCSQRLALLNGKPARLEV